MSKTTIPTGGITADAINATLIADDAISEEHIDATVITGTTALAENPAKTDELLISDAGTLKRVDLTHLYPTPLVNVRMDTSPTFSHNTATKLVLDTEIVDSDGKFDNSTNYRFTPTVAGYYFVHTQIEFVNTAGQSYIDIRKNGSADNSNIGRGAQGKADDANNENTPSLSTIVYLDADDYIESFAAQESGSDKTGRFGRLLVFKLNHGGTSS